jgi:hypothetical protein
MGCTVNAAHLDFLLTLASVGDVVGRLHPHERVHLHAESLLDTSPMSLARSAAPFIKLERAGRKSWSAVSAAAQSALRFNDLRADEIVGMERVPDGHGRCALRL